MAKPEYVYVTYISSTREKIWKAITDPETTPRYWQHANVSDWKPGSRWEHRENGKDGKPLIVGKVVEFSPPRRLVFTWADPADEHNEEKYSRVTFELEEVRGVVRLTVVHDNLEPGSKMLKGISDGWPKVLSSMKTFLESGKPLPRLW